ncbi:MAG: glucuronate isomerase [Lactobacillaceae bacterium]
MNDEIYGDHYKWRLERANGIPKELIIDNGDEYQKFIT